MYGRTDPHHLSLGSRYRDIVSYRVKFHSPIACVTGYSLLIRTLSMHSCIPVKYGGGKGGRERKTVSYSTDQCNATTAYTY